MRMEPFLILLFAICLALPAFAQWEPPIGIPSPSFGIDESYLMYNEEANRNPGLEYSPNALDGFYTHYVDNSDGCSDSGGNDYGTESSPRCNFPAESSIGPGSVVEIHGGPYEGTVPLRINGGQTQPIFIRGPSINDRPVFHDTMTVRGHYIIVENLEFDMSTIQYSKSAILVRAHEVDGVGEEVHHVSVRNIEAHGTPQHLIDSGAKITTMMFAVSYVPGLFVEDVVFYNNHVHPDNLVPPDISSEPDNAGIGVQFRTNRIWIVDNNIHSLAGDCVGSGHSADYTATNYYIGRNIMHDTSENAVDLKEVDTAIVSENIMYNFPGGSSGDGGDGVAVVLHHGPTDAPRNTWLLFNEIYNTTGSGIQVGGGQTDDVYIIGNVVHDLHDGIVADYLFASFDEAEDILPRLVQKGYVDAAGRVDPGFTGLDAEFMGWFSPGYGQFTHIEVVLQRVSSNADSATVYRSWASEGVYIVDNVFYDVDNGPDSDVPAPGHLILHNNIISNISDGGYHLSLFRDRDLAQVSNNLFHQPGGETSVVWENYSTVYNLSEFQQNTGKCQGCLEGNPWFVDPDNGDFSLQAGSPAIGRGTEHSVYQLFEATFDLDIRVDFDGNPRTGWDIGAFESQGSTCIDTDLLLGYITRWEQGSTSMPVLILRIAAWKSGEGC